MNVGRSASRALPCTTQRLPAPLRNPTAAIAHHSVQIELDDASLYVPAAQGRHCAMPAGHGGRGARSPGSQHTAGPLAHPLPPSATLCSCLCKIPACQQRLAVLPATTPTPTPRTVGRVVARTAGNGAIWPLTCQVGPSCACWAGGAAVAVLAKSAGWAQRAHLCVGVGGAIVPSKPQNTCCLFSALSRPLTPQLQPAAAARSARAAAASSGSSRHASKQQRVRRWRHRQRHPSSPLRTSPQRCPRGGCLGRRPCTAQPALGDLWRRGTGRRRRGRCPSRRRQPPPPGLRPPLLARWCSARHAREAILRRGGAATRSSAVCSLNTSVLCSQRTAPNGPLVAPNLLRTAPRPCALRATQQRNTAGCTATAAAAPL